MVNFLYLSELLGRAILDIDGRQLGRVKDFALSPTGEKFPEIAAIVISRRGSPAAKIQWSLVNRVDKKISLSLPLGKIKPQPVAHAKDVLLAKNLLDQQIVDTDGLKVVRVNDVVLSEAGGKMCVVSIDVGTRGLLRRLSAEGLANLLGIQEKLLPWGFAEPLQPKLRQLRVRLPKRELSDLHPADIASVVADLSTYEREIVMKSLDSEKTADTLAKLDDRARAAFMAQVEDDRAAKLLSELPPDDAADLLAEISSERSKTIIGLMESDIAARILDLMRYKERTVGSIMTPEFFQLPPEATVRDAERLMRKHPDRKVFYYIFVTDADGKLKGIVSARRLIISRPSDRLGSLIHPGRRVVKVNQHSNKAKAAGLMAKYDLMAIAVVDSKGKLKGVVTADDAMSAILPPRMSGSLPRFFSPERGG